MQRVAALGEQKMKDEEHGARSIDLARKGEDPRKSNAEVMGNIEEQLAVLSGCMFDLKGSRSGVLLGINNTFPKVAAMSGKAERWTKVPVAGPTLQSSAVTKDSDGHLGFQHYSHSWTKSQKLLLSPRDPVPPSRQQPLSLTAMLAFIPFINSPHLTLEGATTQLKT
ncbi:hypothetical protein STEG23_027546 [Scotinomys teguina]